MKIIKKANLMNLIFFFGLNYSKAGIEINTLIKIKIKKWRGKFLSIFFSITFCGKLIRFRKRRKKIKLRGFREKCDNFLRFGGFSLAGLLNFMKEIINYDWKILFFMRFHFTGFGF